MPVPVYLSAWLTFGLWAAGEYRMARAEAEGSSFRSARTLWSLEAVALALHIGLAFHWAHGWSQSAAVESTARRLQETMGMGWGGGVVINEILVGWWWADAAAAWLRGRRWNRPGLYRSFRRSVFWFLWLNGAVVFASGGRRWIAGVICAGLLWLWWQRFVDARRDSREPHAGSP